MLARAHRLDLLRSLADRIVVPATVAEEVAAHSDETAGMIEDQDWLEPVPAVHVPPSIASRDLGAGETAVLSWASSHPGSLAILDDYAARTYAQVLGIPLVGTLGLALRAKVNGRVASARPLVEELRRAGLYLSDQLIREALALVDE